MKVSLSKQDSSVLEIILLSHLGRIVADKWLMKSQWAAKGTQDLFNLIMHKKVTFRGLFAWAVIPPPCRAHRQLHRLSSEARWGLGKTAVGGIRDEHVLFG